MATYLDVAFDKRLSRVEEQIKQFKTSQEYGLQQMRVYESNNSLSANAIAWNYPLMQMNIYGLHWVIEYVGTNPSRNLLGQIYLWGTGVPASEILWSTGIDNVASLDNHILRFDCYAQHLHIPVPGSSDNPSSSQFTLNCVGQANQEGFLRVVSTSVIQGLWEAPNG